MQEVASHTFGKKSWDWFEAIEPATAMRVSLLEQETALCENNGCLQRSLLACEKLPSRENIVTDKALRNATRLPFM